MDDKDKQENEGNLGAAGVAKMSAHEGVTLAPKSSGVSEAAETGALGVGQDGLAASEAVSGADVVSQKTEGLADAEETITATEAMRLDLTGAAVEATGSDARGTVTATETATVVTPNKIEAVKVTETVQPITPNLPMPPVDPAMMADGLTATVGKKGKKPKISRGAAKMKVEQIDSTPLMMRAPEPTKDDENKMTPDQLIAALNDMPNKGIAMSRREHKWVKLVRGLIWLVIAVTLPVGAAILRRSMLSESLANGTAAGMESWGKAIFYGSLGVAGVNLLWGIVRWFKRWNSERWGILKVTWKLVKGLVVRLLIFTPIVLVALIFVTPVFYNHLAEKFMIERAEIMYSGIMTSDTREFLYGEAVPCRDFCGGDFSLRPGEAKYYYAMAEEFDGVKVEFTGNPQTLIMVMGRQGREWKDVAEFYEKMSYTVATDVGYDAFAFAIKNTTELIEGEETEDGVPMVYDGSEVATVNLSVLAESLVNDVAVNEEAVRKDKCLQVNFDNVVDFPVKLYQMMKELGSGEDLQDVFGSLGGETGANKLVRHFATVCTQEMKTEVDYDKIQMDLVKAIGGNWRVMDKVGENSHISMYVTYQPLVGEATGYFLIRAGENTEVVRLKIEEKTPGL